MKEKHREMELRVTGRYLEGESERKVNLGIRRVCVRVTRWRCESCGWDKHTVHTLALRSSRTACQRIVDMLTKKTKSGP